MLMRKEKGITLIALIITIIILIILSAVTINSIVGEDSLINMATEALVRTQIAEYQEELDQIGMMTTADNVFNKLTEKEYLEEFKKKVEESEVFKDKKSAEIMEEEGEKVKLRIVTKEGYVFDVTDKERKYVGKIGDTGFEPLPEIKEGSITIKVETDATEEGTWTKGPVHATIEVSKELEGLTIQYTKDAKAQKGWTNYTTGEKIEITTNGVIIARVKNNIGDVSTYTATETIDNIDTIEPETPTEVEVTKATTNSITVTAKAKDKAEIPETKPGEQSGIKEIIFNITGTVNGEQYSKEITKEIKDAEKTAEIQEECIFTELKQNQNYTITVKAVDKAGNESKLATTNKETNTVPGESTEKNGSIKFTYDPQLGDGEWTNKAVKVTITSTATDGETYTIEYIKGTPTGNNDKWEPYNNTPIEMTSNGTITARLKDSQGQTGATATGTVSNIDTNPPSEPDITIQGTQKEGVADTYTTEIKVTITPGTDKVNESGVKETTYSVTGQNQASLPSGTIQGIDTKEVTLKEDGTYTITAQTTDNAGNISVANKVTFTINTIKFGDIVTYGDYVNYPVDIDGVTNDNDWKIFYKNSDERVFIIADDYVQNTYSKTARNLAKLNDTSNTYCSYWSTRPVYRSNWTTHSELFMATGFILNDSWMAGRCVSNLLDTDNWTSFLDNSNGEGIGQYAIGGPTLEMWCESWNLAVSSSTKFKKLYAKDTANYGYYVSSDSETKKTTLYMNGTTSALSETELNELGQKFGMYFPHIQDLSGCRRLLVSVPFRSQ